MFVPKEDKVAQVKEILDNFHLQVIREHAIKNLIINGRARLGLVPPFSWMFADVTIERQIFYVYWADENAFFLLARYSKNKSSEYESFISANHFQYPWTW